MNKSQKLLLISFLPVFCALLFIIYVFVPTIQNLNQTQQELKEAQSSYNDNLAELDSLNQNKSLVKKLEKLSAELNTFEYQFPADNDLAIFLVDLEKYAQSYNAKIVTLSSEPAKDLDIVDTSKKTTKKKKKSAKKKNEFPLQLSEIPITLNVVGYFSNVIKVVDFLEKYQRQVVIESIKINNEKDAKSTDIDLFKPKLDLEIKAKIYTVTKQTTNHDLK